MLLVINSKFEITDLNYLLLQAIIQDDVTQRFSAAGNQLYISDVSF